MTANSFGSRATLRSGETDHVIYRLDAVDGAGSLPFSLKILLENLLRNEDGRQVTAEHITALAQWDPGAEPATEIQFTPARVILQDLTGVPAVVDLATMREAMRDLGGDPAKINPLVPAELVIDHSVVADVFGRPDAFDRNVDLEFQRNKERFAFLRWGQQAFSQFKVVPPGTGIVHQVNIEHLARVVMTHDGAAYPDTCVGTDSHTTMQNGLGVLGWGVGGIEAEAAMLGQAISMLIPKVVGFRLTRRAARWRHRHRPGAHHHRDAAPARRGRQVRRVPRGRGGRGAGRQPGHDRQHEPRVRVHLRDLPHRPGDPDLPAPHRPPGGPGRAGRGVRQGAGPVARERAARPVLRGTVPRPVHGRPVAGRPEAAAGPGGAGRRQDRVPRGARVLRRSSTGWTTTSPIPSPPPIRLRRTGKTAKKPSPANGPRQAPATAVRPRRSRSPWRTAPRPPWTTARS